MDQLDFILGPVLIGTLLSTFLSGVMLVQCYNYYVRYPKDPAWMKIMVTYLLLVDMAHAGVESAIAYQYTVSFFGNLQAILIATPLFACIPVFSVLISSVIQSFFAWRVARLTRINILGWMIGILAGVQFLLGVGGTISIIRIPSFAESANFEGFIIPWLVCAMLCDVLITISLCWYLWMNRTGFSSTDDLITKTIRATVQTGLMTSIWAILDLIALYALNNAVHLIFNFPFAKIYTNWLMSVLNARKAHYEALRASAITNTELGDANTSDPWGFNLTTAFIGSFDSEPPAYWQDSMSGSDVNSFRPQVLFIRTKDTHTSRTFDIHLPRNIGSGDPMDDGGVNYF